MGLILIKKSCLFLEAEGSISQFSFKLFRCKCSLNGLKVRVEYRVGTGLPRLSSAAPQRDDNEKQKGCDEKNGSKPDLDKESPEQNPQNCFQDS